MNFQRIVVLIAIVLLIIALVFIGYALYSHKFNKQFPPVTAECPDYWVAKDGKCTNPKNLGKCTGPMDFNTANFQGDGGDCAKAEWANNCNISWSGLTTNPDVCNKDNN